MGGCVSSHKHGHASNMTCHGCISSRKDRPVVENKFQKGRKGCGKIVTPVPGTSSPDSRGELNGNGHTDETMINNCISLSCDNQSRKQETPQMETVNVHDGEVSIPARGTPAASKDDAFFDSFPFLESDAEDDFITVNGDTLQSTWSHSNNAHVTPRPSVSTLKERMAKVEQWTDDSTQVQQKNKLKDFFMERLSIDGGILEEDHSGSSDAKVSSLFDSNVSGHSWDDTATSKPSSDIKAKEEKKSLKGFDKQMSKCCLPHISSNFSCIERRPSVQHRKLQDVKPSLVKPGSRTDQNMDSVA